MVFVFCGCCHVSKMDPMLTPAVSLGLCLYRWMQMEFTRVPIEHKTLYALINRSLNWLHDACVLTSMEGCSQHHAQTTAMTLLLKSSALNPLLHAFVLRCQHSPQEATLPDTGIWSSPLTALSASSAAQTLKMKRNHRHQPLRHG